MIPTLKPLTDTFNCPLCGSAMKQADGAPAATKYFGHEIVRVWSCSNEKCGHRRPLGFEKFFNGRK